eukprot:442024_1
MASTQTKLQGHSSSIQHRTSIPIHWHQHGIHTRIEYIPNAINPVRIQSRSLDSITGITECFNVKLHLQQQRCGRDQSKQCDWQQISGVRCVQIASSQVFTTHHQLHQNAILLRLRSTRGYLNGKEDLLGYKNWIWHHHDSNRMIASKRVRMRHHETEIKDVPIDVQQLIRVFDPKSEEEDANNINTLWLARYGFGVLSGVYWWYNVVYNEDAENDGDVNNDSVEILHNMKRPAYNIFLNDIVDSLKREVLVKLCHSVGMNGNVLLSIRSYLSAMEEELESLKPWHLKTEQFEHNKSNPSTPTPKLQPMSSMGHPDLGPIIEEQEDDMIALALNGVVPNDDDTKELRLDDGWDDDDDLIGAIDIGDNDDDEDVDFAEIDPSKLKKMQRTQQLVDELKQWNEYMELFGVSCYYHSLWVLLQHDDCIENEGMMFRQHSKHMWKCIQLLFDQLTTLPAGIEFGEFILRFNESELLNSTQFHEQGLWTLVQSLTAQLKGISDRALHQKLWKFIVHLINSADLATRFQCIVSTALQCPIPVVQSLMFTELKNQIFNNWNPNAGREEEQILNPFCSRQVVMVAVQRLGKELQNMSLQTINSELDSLNACLNLCRFLLMKDVKTNYTQIYDEDCPLRVVIRSLFEQMTQIHCSNKNKEKTDELQRFQRQMMKNQFAVSLDLVKRIQEMYNK